ncbi:hypothetical protein BDQ17DRAFT_1232530 [Cyathus striatus]|nr:hypothetical protein BDQ17DRAFT_1232530 [Cyathus striatus]
MSSSDAPARKKRPASDANPAPDGDHRKRRRNRTTQSCLNCHTSKRMCDRKRPACARCTQLGLTGLCVYEVDDPNQRPEAQDESSRLLKRVAELEGVIRELKNKPHPRWVQSGNGSEDFEKWQVRPQTRSGCDGQSTSNAPSPSSSLSEKGERSSSDSDGDSRPPGKPSNGYLPPVHLNTDHTRRRSSYCGTSPHSTPSPTLMTPTEEFSPHISIVHPPDVPHDYDLTSMFLSYPGLMGCEDGTYNLHGKDNRQDGVSSLKQVSQCGCLHETASYNAVLELSLRLRKAADILARSSIHHMGPACPLQRQIVELDALATNALGNIATPPEELTGAISPHDRLPQMYGSRSLGNATISPQSLHSLRTWDMLPNGSSSPVSCDDSFMSWEPQRRA